MRGLGIEKIWQTKNSPLKVQKSRQNDEGNKITKAGSTVKQQSGKKELKKAEEEIHR